MSEVKWSLLVASLGVPRYADDVTKARKKISLKNTVYTYISINYTQKTHVDDDARAAGR